MRGAPAGEGLARYDDYYAKRYHKPGDEYQDAWDVSGSVEDLRLLFDVGAHVAFGKGWPQWNEGNEYRTTRDASAKSREPPK